MSLQWNIANTENQPGRFDAVTKYWPPNESFAASEIMVPEQADKKLVQHATGGLLSDTIRSFEIHWDKPNKEMKIVLCGEESDMPLYSNAYTNMYPNCVIKPMKEHVPEWFRRERPYSYFNISNKNGNHIVLWEDTEAEHFMTQLVTVLQLAKYAWFQCVFRKAPMFTGVLQSYTKRLINYKKLLVGDEKGYDFSNNAQTLQKMAMEKQNDVQGLLSLRGLVEFEDEHDIIKQIPCSMIKATGIDILESYSYHSNRFFSNAAPHYINSLGEQRCDIFPKRMLPSPKPYIRDILKYTESKSGKYPPRSPLPFLMVIPKEMRTFLQLPDPSISGGVIKTTKKQMMASSPTTKLGINIGFFVPTLLEEQDYYGMFGFQTISKDAEAVTMSFPKDFKTHCFCVGGTGSGKTSVILAVLKNFEMGNVYSQYPKNRKVREILEEGNLDDEYNLRYADPDKALAEANVIEENAVIMIDPKGQDSKHFIEQTEKMSRDNDKIHYLDPLLAPFSINPFELPDNIPARARAHTVEMYKGNLMSMLESLFGASKTFVFLNRVMGLLVTYLYQNRDDPIFTDIYEIIKEIVNTKGNPVQAIEEKFGPATDEVKSALQNISAKDASAFDSIFNRLEQIETSAIFKNMFCRRKSTIRAEEIIKPGHYTIVKIGEGNVPKSMTYLIMQVLVAQIWFAVQQRAEVIPDESKRKLVLLVVDEFQKMKEFDMLKDITEQGRSMGMGLFLACQNLEQIDDKVLGTILSNTHTKFIGKIMGEDAQRLANLMEPLEKSKLASRLLQHTEYQWTAQIKPEDGGERLTPIEFVTHYDKTSDAVTKSNMTHDEWIDYLKIQTEEHAPPEMEEKTYMSNPWVRQLGVEFIKKKVEWYILLILDKSNTRAATLQEISNSLVLKGVWEDGQFNRNIVRREFLPQLVEKGLVNRVNLKTMEIYKMEDFDGINDKIPQAAGYSISKKAVDNYFRYKGEVGGAEDIADMSEILIDYYKEQNNFIVEAPQKKQKGKNRTDFVAYDYKTHKSISVELESFVEVQSHEEQVLKNMLKWKEMGFDECHVWSTNPKIKELAKRLDPGRC